MEYKFELLGIKDLASIQKWVESERNYDFPQIIFKEYFFQFYYIAHFENHLENQKSSQTKIQYLSFALVNILRSLSIYGEYVREKMNRESHQFCSVSMIAKCQSENNQK